MEAPPDPFLRRMAELGGETGRLLAARDWGATPLGPAAAWPAALRATLGVVLPSRPPLALLWGPEGVLFYNDAYAAIAGARHPAILGAPVREGWPELADFNGRVLEVVLAGGTLAFRGQELTLHRHGRPETVVMNLDYSPVPGEDGRPAGVLAVVGETTAEVEAERRRQEAEAALRAERDRAQGVLDNMDEAFVLLDAELRFVDLNAKALELERRPREALLGLSHWEAHPEADPEIGELFRRALRERRPVSREHRYRWADGRDAWIDMRAYPVGDGLAVFYRDVTERKRTEEALVEREGELRTLTDALPVLVSHIDADRRYRFVNRLYEDWFPMSRESVLGRHVRDVVGEEAYARAAPRMDAALRGESVRFEELMPYRDAPHRHVAGEFVPRVAADGAVTGFYALVQDVGEQRAAARALEEARAAAEAEAARREAILSQLAEGVVVTDRDGRIVFVNEAAERLHGTAALDVGPSGYPEAFHLLTEAGEPHPFETLPLTRAVRGETVNDARWRVRRPDGTEVLAVGSARPVRDAAGRPIGAVLTLRDETARVAAETALRESEARVRAVADNLPSGMVYQLTTGRDDTERRFTYVSQSHLDLTGIPAEAVLADARVAYDLVLPEDRERLRLAEERTLGDGTPFDVQVRIRRADGEVRWTRISSAPRRQADGTLVWDGLQVDVTDERRGAEALAESRRRLEELNATLAARVAARTAERDRMWQLSEDILARADYTGRVLAVSPAWTRILGWPDTDPSDQPFAELIHPEDREATLEALGRMAATGQPTRYENRVARADGGWTPIEWVVAPEPEGASFIAVGRDLTAVKAREAELRQAQEALRQSQKMEAMGQLTGGVAHDFNNLLTPIVGSLDRLLQRGLGDARDRRLMEGALEAAERARILVQRLLAFARRQPLQPTAVALGPLLHGMADLLSSTLGPRIEVRLRIPPDLPPAVAEANQLEMALLNLAVNARDAMPGGGVLTISAEAGGADADAPADLAPGRYVRLSVEDTGVGMDEATRARAVEPFFSTKGIGRGTGLGLSMVHGLARQLRGGMAIASAPGEGTAVRLWLPASAEAAAPPRAAPAGGPSPARGTVLVVDDERLVRAATADMLAELGYGVVEASSGEEALELVRGGLAPDVLVTDHLMPGLTGAGLIEALRAEGRAVPSLVVSGYADLGGIPAAVPRLAKPFRQAELAARLAEVLSGAAGIPAGAGGSGA